MLGDRGLGVRHRQAADVSPAAARTVADGLETWDLRTKPGRADVGLLGRAATSSYATKRSRRLRVLLPEGRHAEMHARVVTFQSISSVLMHSDDPAAMDVATYVLTRDEAYRLFKQNLTEVGMPTARADDWLEQAKDAESQKGDPNATTVASGAGVKIGYLELGITARFFPREQNADIAWILDWGPDPLAAR